MNKNTKSLMFGIIVLIITVVITVVIGNMPTKNGLDGLEKAGWFTLFFVLSIVDAIVVIVNIVICLVVGKNRDTSTDENM